MDSQEIQRDKQQRKDTYKQLMRQSQAEQFVAGDAVEYSCDGYGTTWQGTVIAVYPEYDEIVVESFGPHILKLQDYKVHKIDVVSCRYRSFTGSITK